MVTLVSARRTVYQHSFRGSLRGIFETSPRLASIGAESMASTRHRFRQSRADVAALLGQGQGRACRDDLVREHLRHAEPRSRRGDYQSDALPSGSAQGALWEGGPLRGDPPLAGATPGEQPRNGQGEGTGSAVPLKSPQADAPRQKGAAFLSRHKFCFAFALQGACPRHDCSLKHDDSLIPAGFSREQGAFSKPEEGGC